MKKVLGIAAVVGLSLSCMMVANAESAASGHTVGFIQLTLQSNYHSAMSDHFEEIANEAGMTAVMTNGEWAADEQLSLCEDLLAQGCEAIILNPTGDEVVPVIQARCEEEGVPLICVDNTSPGAGYVYCGIDNFAIARGIGQYVGEKYGSGNMVYVRSTAIDTGCPAYRWGGVMGGLSDEGEVAGYNLLDERYVDDVSFDEGMSKMEEMLAANDEDIDIVICHRDGEALGAITAIESAGREVKVVTGFDGEKALLEKIKEHEGGANGCDIVTGLNSPIMVADLAMEALETYFSGGTMSSSYYTPVVTVSYENVDEYMDYGF